MTETKEKIIIAIVFLIVCAWFIETALTVAPNYYHARCEQTATNKESC